MPRTSSPRPESSTDMTGTDSELLPHLLAKIIVYEKRSQILKHAPQKDPHLFSGLQPQRDQTICFYAERQQEKADNYNIAHAASGSVQVTAAQGHADKAAQQPSPTITAMARATTVRGTPPCWRRCRRTQIVGVGNEDLVHDVVQCPHQQGDHAGNGVAAHEPPHMLRSQKIVGAFHKISLPSLQNPRLRTFLPQKTRGASATRFTQKRHTL